MEEGDKRLSTASLVVLFLLGVVVCAVFFSLGFLLGYRERSSGNTAQVERVTPTGDAPPVVNPSPAKQEPSVRQEATPVSLGSTAQPPEAEPDAKSENVASGNRASEQNAGPVTAPAAVEAAPSVPDHESQAAQVPAPTRQAPTGSSALQVAALQTKQDAEALVKVLKERGYPVFLVSPEDAHANDNLFRVRVGPFVSRDEEEKTRQELETEGFKPFVKR
jgi:cell division septation protein DedD